MGGFSKINPDSSGMWEGDDLNIISECKTSVAGSSFIDFMNGMQFIIVKITHF